MYMLVRRLEGRMKEASKVKRTTWSSNTTHLRQTLRQRKMSYLRWDLNPRHSTRQSAILTKVAQLAGPKILHHIEHVVLHMYRY